MGVSHRDPGWCSERVWGHPLSGEEPHCVCLWSQPPAPLTHEGSVSPLQVTQGSGLCLGPRKLWAAMGSPSAQPPHLPLCVSLEP